MAKKEAAKTEVAVKNEDAVAAFSNDTPAYINKNSNLGNEEVGAKDMVLPRLEIVQALSPIKDELGPESEGQLFNSASGELIGDVAYFIPVYFRAEWLLWRDKDLGGGFGGAFNTQAEAETERKKRLADDPRAQEADWEVVDTPVHYGLLVKPDDPTFCQQIVISMAKTKAKVSRKWNAMIQIVGGDRFSRVYKITTFKDKNSQGKEFFNFVVQNAGFPPENLYNEAKKTYAVFRQGVKVDHASTVDMDSGVPNNGNDPIDRGGI